MTTTAGPERLLLGSATRVTSPPHTRHLAGLDGIRGIAVAAVVLYHVGMPWLPGGFLGVDVFFVLSGFLITHILLSEIETTGELRFGRFYERRARRLFPALLVMLGAVGVAAWIAPHIQAASLRGDVAAAAGYASNWWYIFREQSYFEFAGRLPLLQHLWSLGVEEQFYLVWPLLCVVLVRWGSRSAVRSFAIGGALLSAAWMAYLALRTGAPIDTDPSRIYYGTDTHAMGLLAGAALAAAWRPRRGEEAAPSTRAAAYVLGAAGLTVMLWFFTRVNEYTDWLYRGGFLVLAASVVAVIAACLVQGGMLGEVLDTQPLRYLGERSYGIYLWHWPVFLVTRPGLDVPDLGWITTVARIGLVLAIAEVSFRIVEQPIRQRRLLAGRHLWVSLLGVVVLVTAVAIAFATIMRPGHAVPGDEEIVMPGASTAISTLPTLAPTPTAVATPAGTPSAGTPTPAPTVGVTPEPTPGVHVAWPQPVSVFGDSVILGASFRLDDVFPQLSVDAVESRQADATVDAVAAAKANGALADIVVVHVGTNGIVTTEELDHLGAIVGDRTLLLVNVHVDRPWAQPNNDTITRWLTAHPEVTLVDWDGFAHDHPDLLAGDGIHLDFDKAIAFCAYLRDTVKSAIGA